MGVIREGREVGAPKTKVQPKMGSATREKWTRDCGANAGLANAYVAAAYVSGEMHSGIDMDGAGWKVNWFGGSSSFV